MGKVDYQVGKTYELLPPDYEDGGRLGLRQVFHVLGYVEGESEPYVHFHAFGYKPDAEELLAKVREAAREQRERMGYY